MKTVTALETSVKWLGQSDFGFDFGGFVALTDPYLADSVAAVDGPDFARILLRFGLILDPEQL